MRLTSSNFTDLAVTLWQGRCQLSDLELHRETLRRIARALGSGYGDESSGETPPALVTPGSSARRTAGRSGGQPTSPVDETR